jgi:hypothetical protein
MSTIVASVTVGSLVCFSSNVQRPLLEQILAELGPQREGAYEESQAGCKEEGEEDLVDCCQLVCLWECREPYAIPSDIPIRTEFVWEDAGEFGVVCQALLDVRESIVQRQVHGLDLVKV